MKKKKTLSALCSLLLTLSLTPMVAAAQPAAQTADDSFKPCCALPSSAICTSQEIEAIMCSAAPSPKP